MVCPTFKVFWWPSWIWHHSSKFHHILLINFWTLFSSLSFEHSSLVESTPKPTPYQCLGDHQGTPRSSWHQLWTSLALKTLWGCPKSAAAWRHFSSPIKQRAAKVSAPGQETSGKPGGPLLSGTLAKEHPAAVSWLHGGSLCHSAMTSYFIHQACLQHDSVNNNRWGQPRSWTWWVSIWLQSTAESRWTCMQPASVTRGSATI